MDTHSMVELGAAIVISLLGWSLKTNVAAFRKDLDGVTAEFSRLVGSMNAHDTAIEVLKVEVAHMSKRL